MIELEFEEQKNSGATITVIGVGGAGGNTINSIIDSGYNAINFVAANTDAQALAFSRANNKVQLGVKSTKGLGAGANPELGKRAAEEDLDKIMEVASDSDIVFLTAGMGGGTGSGALPVIAHALKEKGILSIVVITKPFLFEGSRRTFVAEQAIELLKKEVDTLIVIPNQRLLEVTDKTISMIDAFSMVNDILGQSVKGISDIIAKPGHINVDFADVRTIMKDMGLAVMGTGKASGEDRAQQAALKAISSPLLENMSIDGAHGVLLNISGGRNLGLHEISEAASVIYDQAAQDAHIIVGAVFDDTMDEEISVTIIATGFDVSHKDISVKKAAIRDTETIPDVGIHEATPVQVCDDASKTVEQKDSNDEKELTIELAEKDNQLNETVIDYNDLDVPAFLRKKVHEKNDMQ